MWNVSGVYWITDTSATIKHEIFFKNDPGFRSIQRLSA